jgi:hypothetical protein
VNPFSQLPIWLYGVGIAFIFSGIVWAQLTRRAHLTPISTSLGGQNEGSIGAKDERDSAEFEDEFHDISGFGKAGHNERKGLVARRGVRAIFSSDEDWSTEQHERSRMNWISTTMLLNIIGWGLFLVVYGFLVQEYSSNAYMQSWIRTKFSFGVYLLNDYTLLLTATMLGFLLFRMLFLNWRQAKARRLD